MNSIFVTGAPRTGTTWTGITIAQAKNVNYIPELFIPNTSYFQISPVKYWFEYISNDSDRERQSEFKKFLSNVFYSSENNRYLLRNVQILEHYLKNYLKLQNLSKIKDTDGIIKVYNKILELSNILISKRSLLKDPIALLSAEWIYKTFHPNVVVLIRHPAAFVASYKILKWTHDFNHFRLQRELMNDHLSSFKEKVELYSIDPPDIVDQAILLWNILNSRIYEYYENYQKSWFFIRYMDLAFDPVTEFRRIFDYLNLEYTKKIRDQIINSSDGSIVGYLQKNSSQNVGKWHEILSAKEIEKIRFETQNIAQHFYSEGDWKINN